MMYLIAKEFHEVDIGKIKAQPISWIFTIWKHMNTERTAVTNRNQDLSSR